MKKVYPHTATQADIPKMAKVKRTREGYEVVGNMKRKAPTADAQHRES